MTEESSSSNEIVNVEDIEVESPENVEPCTKKLKISWENYFKFNSSTKKYKCLVKYCRSELREAQNPKRMSHLFRHLREVHRIKETSEDEPSTSGLDQFLCATTSAKTLTFEDKMVKFIVLTNQPFTVVEQSSFHDLFPKEAKWMTAMTIQSKIMKMFETRKDKLRDELKEVQGKLSLIIDGWQSPNLFEFVGIIATYIDKEWRPQFRVLDFAVLEGRANAKELTKVIVKALEEFEVADRIHAITVDNASVMDAMLKELGATLGSKDSPVVFNPKHQHIRCLNHVLNLSCQNALTVLKAVEPVEDDRLSAEELEPNYEEDDQSDAGDGNDDIEQEVNDDDFNNDESSEQSASILLPYMKRIISKVRKSSTFHGEFTQMAKILGVKPLQLIQDVIVRWNSTYLMLQRVIEMRKVVDALIQKFAVLQVYKLSEAEWTLLGQICDLLKPFHNLTQQLSREDRPLLSLAAAVYMELFEHLKKFRKSVGSSSQLSQAVDRAESKLLKYWAISGSRAYTLGLGTLSKMLFDSNLKYAGICSSEALDCFLELVLNNFFGRNHCKNLTKL